MSLQPEDQRLQHRLRLVVAAFLFLMVAVIILASIVGAFVGVDVSSAVPFVALLLGAGAALLGINLSAFRRNGNGT